MRPEGWRSPSSDARARSCIGIDLVERMAKHASGRAPNQRLEPTGLSRGETPCPYAARSTTRRATSSRRARAASTGTSARYCRASWR